jgi:integrase
MSPRGRTAPRREHFSPSSGCRPSSDVSGDQRRLEGRQPSSPSLIGYGPASGDPEPSSSPIPAAGRENAALEPREAEPAAYRLPLLWLDWSGARLGSVDALTVADYDERDRRIRLRASTTKTRAALWVELPDALADAIEATLPPREDRDPAAPLFPGVSADRLGTAIGRACQAAGVPVFSPHDLRHRRIGLLHRPGPLVG